MKNRFLSALLLAALFIGMVPAIAADSAFNSFTNTTTADGDEWAFYRSGTGMRNILSENIASYVFTKNAANLTLVDTGALRTTTTTANTGLIQAYDVDGTTYRSFITLTNGNVPSMALAAPSGGTATLSGLTVSSVFTPTTSDGAALGTGSLMWSDLFLASGGVINIANGDLTMTHSSNAMTFAGASSGWQFSDPILPSSNDAAAMGSASVSWSDLFLASGGVIGFANGDAAITHSTNLLAFSGASSGYSFDAVVSANGGVTIGNGATSSGVLTINEDTDAGSNFASFQVPSLAANTVYTLPADDGDSGEQLQTNGSGVLTWEAAGSGGGGELSDGDKGEITVASSGTVWTIDDDIALTATSISLGNTGLKIADTNASHNLIIDAGSNLTADRALSIITGDAARTLTFTGNASIGGTNTGDQTTITGNAGTATALATNGSNCSAGSAPIGVDASGAVESCTDYEEDLSNSAGLLAALSDETGTSLAVFSNSPTFTDDFDLAAAGVRMTGADGVLTLLGLGNGNDEALAIDFDNGSANVVGISSSTAVTDLDLGTIDLNTDTLDLTGTGTINGLDAIDGTTETTLEAALDLAGDVSATGLGNSVIGNDKILESMLKAVDSATDEECLTYETTTGDFEWQGCNTADATLTAFAAWANGTNKIPYTTSTDTFASLDFKDEDDFASNSATAVPSQQSVKAYVDSSLGGFDYQFFLSSGTDSAIMDLNAGGDVGGTYSIGIGYGVQTAFTYDLDGSGNVVEEGLGVTTVTGRGGEIFALGSQAGSQPTFCNGNATVCIGRDPRVDCVNGVSIGDGNQMRCSPADTEKSTVIGNDNILHGEVNHATFLGQNLLTTSGCDQCGAIGENIENSMDGSFGIGNPTGSTETVGLANTLWSPLWFKPAEDTEANFPTCNSTARGVFGFNTTEGAMMLCDGTVWNSLTQVPSSGANATVISQYAMTYLDETSAANTRTALGVAIGSNVQAYDADLTTLSSPGAAFLTLVDDATTSTLRTSMGVAIGSDVQAYDADLTTLSSSTAAFLTLADDTTTAAMRTTLGLKQEYCYAISDYNTTTITASNGLATEYLPAAFTVTGVRAYARTAPTGTMTIDINEAGTTILSTKLTLDANEKTSGTAAAAAVISDTAIAANAEITVDVDSTTGGKGGVVCLEGSF